MENSTFIVMVRKHWAGIVLSFLFGLLIVSPYVVYHVQQDGELVMPVLVNDQNFYLARIQEVIDGHGLINNPYLAEYKSGPPQQLFLGELLLALPLMLSGLSAAQGMVVYAMILPCAVALLVYIIGYRIGGLRSHAVVAMVAIMFGTYPLQFTRLVSPQFNMIFWLTLFWIVGALVRHFDVLSSRRRWMLVLLGAGNLGLLFYIYPYYWTYFLVFLGLLVFVFWFQKERRLAMYLFGMTTLGVVAGSYYMYYTAQAARLPYYEESMTRLQMLYSHFPSGINVVFVALAVLILLGVLVWRKRISIDRRTVFFICALVAAMLVTNQHVITGRHFEFSSHYIQVTVMSAAFALLYVLHRVPKRNLRNVILTLAIGVYCIFGLQNYVYAIYANGVSADRANEPVLRWIRENSDFDSVVFADNELSELIPIYTHADVVFTRNANLSLMPDQDVYERFSSIYYGTTIDSQFVQTHEREVFGVRYVDRYNHIQQGNKLRKLLGMVPVTVERISQTAIDRVVAVAEEVHDRTFAEVLLWYHVDLVVLDSTDARMQDVIAAGGVEVFRDASWIIFKVDE